MVVLNENFTGRNTFLYFLALLAVKNFAFARGIQNTIYDCRIRRVLANGRDAD